MSFTEKNLIPNAGLLPAAALAQRIGLAEVIDERLRLAVHGASSGAKALTVIGSILAGGDSIDDTALLRAGAAAELFDATQAPSTIGSWLPAHKWSNVRQLDAVSRELLGRLWAAGAGPGDLSGPLTIDLDSSIVAVYGRGKQGAAFGYTKVRGYHPQFAACAQSGMVLFSRLRGGSAGAARGAKSDLTETFTSFWVCRCSFSVGVLNENGDQGITWTMTTLPVRSRPAQQRTPPPSDCGRCGPRRQGSRTRSTSLNTGL